MFTRRSFRLGISWLLSVFLSTLTLSALSAQAQQPPKRLTVNVWGGLYEELTRKYVAKPFEEKHKVKVEFVLGGVDISKLRAEVQAGSPSIDVLNFSFHNYLQAEREGLLEKLDLENMPESKNLYSQARYGPFAVITNYGVFGIAYRKDKISKPPVSWFDLWDPAYKQAIASRDIDVAHTLELLQLLATLGGGGPNNLDPGFKKFKELRPNIKMWVASHADMQNALTRGEVAIGIENNSRTLAMKKAGVPVEFVIPKEGGLAQITLVGISKGTKNKVFAEKLINEMLTAEAQKAFAVEGLYGPSIKTITIDPEIAKYMPYGQEQVSRLVNLDPIVMDKIGEIVERWNKEIR